MNILTTHYPYVQNPLEQIQCLLKQIDDLNHFLCQKEKEIETLKNPFAQACLTNISEQNGIISSLKLIDQTPVIVSSSSNHTGIPGNVLTLNDSYWISKNQKNSWILFNFNNKRVSPSGYTIRNLNKGGWFSHSPQGWRLEGSNDQKNWVVIHEVKNNTTFQKSNEVGIFACQTSQYFSFLKLTQIQENLNKSDYFVLNFIDFFGKTNNKV